MSEPTTEAGRRLVAGMPWTTSGERQSWERLVAAIEAEARTPLETQFDAYREAVQMSEPTMSDGKPPCPTGYAQRYHDIGECDCLAQSVTTPDGRTYRNEAEAGQYQWTGSQLVITHYDFNSPPNEGGFREVVLDWATERNVHTGDEVILEDDGDVRQVGRVRCLVAIVEPITNRDQPYTEDDPDWSAMVSPISEKDGGHDDR